MVRAAAGGHTQDVLYLVKRGADPNVKDSSGRSALMLAAQDGHAATVNALIRLGADPNAQDAEGQTALILAAQAGHLDIVRTLLNAGAQVNAMDKDGGTAVIWAALSGYPDIVKALLAGGASLNVGSFWDLASHQWAQSVLASGSPGAAGGSMLAPGPAAAPYSAVDTAKYRLAENPRKWAVVVGVENYLTAPRAIYALHDASAVKRHLQALGYPERNIAMLTDLSASRARLAEYIERWLRANVNERSEVFFYFAGHGAADPVSGRAYLVPVDGDPTDLEDTAYPLARLYEKLSRLKARELVIALDACFSGQGPRSVAPTGERPLLTRIESGALPSRRAVAYAATTSAQTAQTLPNEGHGLFTYYFLSGLNAAPGDGHITVKSLYEYLAPRVMDYARRQGGSQTPQLLPQPLPRPDDWKLR